MTEQQKKQLMRELGRAGGLARAKKLSKEKLSQIGRMGYEANIENMRNAKTGDKVPASAKK